MLTLIRKYFISYEEKPMPIKSDKLLKHLFLFLFILARISPAIQNKTQKIVSAWHVG